MIALEKQKQETLANEQSALAAKQKSETETKAREETIHQQQAQEAAAKIAGEQQAQAWAKAAAEEQAKAEAAQQAQKQQAEEQIKAVEKKADTITYSTDIASNEGKTNYGNLPAVLFEKNEYLLSATAKAELKSAAQKLLKVPQLTVNIYAFASQDENKGVKQNWNRQRKNS